MYPIQKNFIKYGMQGMLRFLSFFARRSYLGSISDTLTAGLAGLVIRQKNVKQVHSTEELGKTWQEAFAAKKLIPITGIDEHTVHAEIRINCPLRGTGDTMACYRMMNFDRKILEQAGGQFIVLQSQAEPGQTFCKVAMRLKDQPVDDLMQAHEKVI